MKLRFHSEASDDLSSTIEYYNSAREGLGAEFLNAVLACIGGAREFPESNPVYLNNYRRSPAETFSLCGHLSGGVR